MLVEKINELRDKLNESILRDDFEETYKISVELDKLIVQYYKEDGFCR